MSNRLQQNPICSKWFAKSEIASKSDSLNHQLQSCLGGTQRWTKDEKEEIFTNGFVQRACTDLNKQDKCNKSYYSQNIDKEKRHT